MLQKKSEISVADRCNFLIQNGAGRAAPLIWKAAWSWMALSMFPGAPRFGDLSYPCCRA
jgi:hypothetical protein